MDLRQLVEWWGEAVRDVLLNPHSFFESLDSTENFKTASIFVVLTHLIVLALYLVVGATGVAVAGVPGGVNLGGIGGALIIVLAIYLPFVLAYTLVTAGFLNIFYYYLGGIGRLSSTYKVVAYQWSAIAIPYTVLSIGAGTTTGAVATVFGVLQFLTMLYGIYVGLVGISIRHDISMWRAAAPYLVMLLIVLLIVIVAVSIAGAMQQMFGGLATPTGLT